MAARYPKRAPAIVDNMNSTISIAHHQYKNMMAVGGKFAQEEHLSE
jgi:hypothetical protein